MNKWFANSVPPLEYTVGNSISTDRWMKECVKKALTHRWVSEVLYLEPATCNEKECANTLKYSKTQVLNGTRTTQTWYLFPVTLDLRFFYVTESLNTPPLTFSKEHIQPCTHALYTQTYIYTLAVLYIYIYAHYLHILSHT